MRRLLSVLLALPVLVLVGSAHAQTTGGGSIGAGGIGSSVEVPGGTGANGADNSAVGGNSSGGTGASSSSGPAATTRWTRHYWGDANDPGYGTNNPVLCGPNERPYQDVQTSVATGEILAQVNGCQAAATTASPVATTSPPPPPPTPAEVRALTPLPAPSFGVSPLGSGLTGLPTWLWDSNPPAPVVATSSIRGYTVVSTARPIRWTWNMAATGPASQSNPPSVVSSSRPGTEANPAATYTYQSKGEYGLTLDVLWGGSFTYSGNGVTPVTTDLGTTTRSSSRSYEVGEVRPVLISR